MENQIKPQQIDIELSEEIAEGIYSNHAIITHSNRNLWWISSK